MGRRRVHRRCFHGSWVCCLSAALVLAAVPLPAGQPEEAKAKGPEHNVTLAEEPAVLDLLTKAQKARAKAEQDPQAWPECVKYYGEILRKYPNSVYLDRWEGPDKKDLAYKNGLYKSTRERVAQDIASLPPAGLAIYRVISDPPARALFIEAQEGLDARKMEQVARDFFPTSWGDDALAWLAETAAGRGSAREALMRVHQALTHPSPSIPKPALLIRACLQELELGDCAAAEKTLQEIEALLPTAKPAEVRLGHDEGSAAVDRLKARLAAARKEPAAQPAAPAASTRSWPTYFGNAAHNRAAPARRNVGLRKWSLPIVQLLYGPSADPVAVQRIANPDGMAVPDPTINCHLTVHEGHFFLCDALSVASYPAGNPQPGAPSAGGNARFIFPGDVQPPPKAPSRSRQIIWRGFGRFGPGGVRHAPWFCTVAADRLFFACGAEAPSAEYSVFRGGEQKESSNYLLALGRQPPGGALESGKLVWSLQADGHAEAFEAQAKADQEWLKSVFFVSAPTWDAGVLYVMAVHSAGLTESWVAAFDDATGRLLWRTQICAANPILISGLVQPARGLPVAVAGGTVFAVTNLGAVAALDAMTGSVKWIRIYDRMATLDRFNNFGVRPAQDFWGPNPPAVHENVVIVTPQDSELLYAYDAETGRRIWEISRTARDPGLKHILGIVSGNLAVTGANVHFYNLKNGCETGPPEPLSFESPIKGRGIVAGDITLVPTERALVSLDTALVDGKFRPAVRSQHRWAEPEREAGNVFVAGDVLYTVSSTHVNAYFVWEEMEARLKERIAQDPADLSAYSELADVYQRVERFEQALTELDKALRMAEQAKDEPKTAAAVADLNRRKFDALLEVGKARQKAAAATPADADAAYEYFRKALDVARLAGQAEALPVIALRAMAENRASAGQAELAVRHYQEIIARHGDAVYTYAPESSAKARLFAWARIEDLKAKAPASYAKVEAAAAAAFQDAAADAQRLEALLAEYPNAEAGTAALLRLARLALPQAPDQARQHAQRFLGRRSRPADAAAATALLAVACERCGLLGPAKDALRRLATRPEFAGLTLPFDPAAAAPAPEAALDAAQWAARRLAEPLFQRAVSEATLSLGDGKLKQAWTKAAGEQSAPLVMQGFVPGEMRRNLFYVENQSELVVLSGTERGDELWLPRPRLPADCIPRPGVNDPLRFSQVAPCPVGLWAGHLLIIAGRREVMAYDSQDKGRLAWRRELRIPHAPPQQFCWLQVDADRLVIAYSAGILSVVDALTGHELWTQSEGSPFLGSPVLGDGFVAAAVEAWQQPRRIVLYALDTGTRRGFVELASAPGATFLAPAGDRLYFATGRDALKAVDANSGKVLWQQPASGTVTGLRATSELVVLVTDNRQVAAFDVVGAEAPRKWTPVLPVGATITGLHVDGEDLYVTVQAPQQKPKLIAFSIPKEGKILWDVELAGDPVNALALSPQTVSARHLVVTESTWDPTGDKPCALVLVDRRTGKLTWSEYLSSDQRPRDPDGMLQPSFRVQVFDGGLAVTEARRRTAYLAQGNRTLDEQLAALADRLARNPDDLDARARLAARRYDKGECEKALQELSVLLGHAQLSADAFVGLYAEFARLRQDYAKKARRPLVFTRVADGARLDAAPETWAGVPETVFDSWRDVYLPSDDETSGAIRKGAWAGPDDLKAAFRGAYDDRNLHLLFAVTDDKHKNDATEANCCDLGDSVKLVFDADRDGGTGFRGEDFELGACLTGSGAVLGWRWVEHGRYLGGATPLAPAPVVVRKEAEKRTCYKFTVPLECLALKPENGRRFGFSFAVNDQDNGDVAKSMCASPGALRPAVPGLFAEGILQEKQ